ncbi:MAG: class I SAM-dependent methyltransferase [Alphaproteobacteria bacterium]|nr:class I SAM-dependent methyltransferase [Alphaproteobacteria bacterium]
MPTRAAQKSHGQFYLAVGLVCAAVMALQILQSRIFSVVTWYHLSFLTISIAMFGLTLGALQVYRGNQEEQRKNLGKHLADYSLYFGLLAVLTLMVQMHVPIVDGNFQSIAFTLPLVAGISAATYYQGGKIVSLCLTRSSLPVGKVYAADMIGASLGCLAAIALMQAMDAPSAVLLVAAAIVANGLMFSRPKNGKSMALVLVVAGALAAMGLVNASMKDRPIYPYWTKGFDLPRRDITFEEWNPISRITVSPDLQKLSAYLWGPSPKLPKDIKTEYQYLRVDGAAGTPIMKFDGKNWGSVKFLEYDLTNLAHFLPNINSFAIIGAGGGRDLLSALYFKAKRVVALDINNIQVKLLKEIPEYRSYTNLWNHPGVDIINSEARSWLTQNAENFDGIQLSMIDTWVSSAAGAFALTENSLYTVDAWKVFLRRLNDNGVLTVSRWHKAGGACNDLCRLATITATALQELGEKNPGKHVFIAHTASIVTFIVGRHEFTKAQLDALHDASKRLDYTILASPRMQPEDKTLRAILHSNTPEDVAAAIRDLPFDVSPSTDNRPFFFNQARIWKPWDVIKQAREGNMFSQNLRGHAVATVNLYIIILFSIVASALVLVLPFRKALAHAPKKFLRAGTVYFALIGLGFMFVEITLMQMMSMFLGHPVYGLGIVLFSMILSSGIGSFISESFPLNTKQRLVTWSLAVASYIALLAASVTPLMETFIEEGFAVRAGLCLLLIFPCGIMRGFAFPTGMKLTDKVSDRLTPWFWGINGAMGVVASAVAMVISIGMGLPFTLLAGALCYGLLAIPSLQLLKKSK